MTVKLKKKKSLNSFLFFFFFDKVVFEILIFTRYGLNAVPSLTKPISGMEDIGFVQEEE